MENGNIEAKNIERIAVGREWEVYGTVNKYIESERKHINQVIAYSNGKWKLLCGEGQEHYFNGRIGVIGADKAGNVYVGGSFKNSKGQEFVAKFDGKVWSELDFGNAGTNVPGLVKDDGQISSMVVDSKGNVYIGGVYTNHKKKMFVARYDGKVWTDTSLADGSFQFNNNILALATDKNDHVYAVGYFRNTKSLGAVAKYDGTKWIDLCADVQIPNGNSLFAVAADGNGNVYAGGGVTNDDGDFIVAKYDGESWTELGKGRGLNASHYIAGLACDSRGNVYAAGRYGNKNGYPWVAVYDGTEWREVGGENAVGCMGYVSSMCLADNMLYAAGDFLDWRENHVLCRSLERRSDWSEMGQGYGTLDLNGPIRTMVSIGKGRLFAAGDFTNAEGKYYVAFFDGKKWRAAGGAKALAVDKKITLLTVGVDDEVFATGEFTNKEGKHYVARFNGRDWRETGKR